MMGGSWRGQGASHSARTACVPATKTGLKDGEENHPTVSPARILCSARTTGGMATSSNQPKALKTMLPLVDACTTDLEHLRSLLEHQLRLVSRSFSALSAVRSQLASGEFNAVEAAETIATVQRHLKSE